MNIEQELRTIISNQLGINPNDFGGTDDFIRDVGADSLDVTEIVIAIESKFNIHLTEEQWHDARTLEAMCELVQKNYG